MNPNRREPEELALGYCGRCGTRLDQSGAPSAGHGGVRCRACGLVNLVRPTVSVGSLPLTPAGEVVLIRRAIAPGIGLWALPGGYLELDETVEEGAARETLEETGYRIELGSLVGLYSVFEAAVVVVVFEARVVGGIARANGEVLEVRSFDPIAIPWSQIGLSSTREALLDWQREQRG